VVSQYLQQNGLFLDHPSLPTDQQRLQACHYFNPHNPPPGGYRSNILSAQKPYAGTINGPRWNQPSVSSKSVEIQRSQMDDLFKSLRSGDELQETEPRMSRVSVSTR
jgi:SWI/SNF-related matrix-associated actin-dependent regulator of chromatin subfamily A3